MRALFCAAGAVLAFCAVTSAQAADYPVKAPPAVFNWTGFYVGLQSGYGWLRGIPDTHESRDVRGHFAGAQVGYNHQLGQNWVVGAEVDAALASVKDTFIQPDPLVPNVIISDGFKMNPMLSARARLGYSLGRTLLYATGGAAWMNVQLKIANPGAGGGPAVIMTESHAHWGATGGGGVETVLAGNWTGKVEYLYAGYNKQTYAIASATPIRFDSHTVKVGINLLLR